MKISGYENIELFVKTQGFNINKYGNQLLRPTIFEADSIDYHRFPAVE
jgi:hypothetical protein